MELWEVILCSLISAAGTGIITISCLKTDMIWIKKIIKDHAHRIYYIEQNMERRKT